MKGALVSIENVNKRFNKNLDVVIESTAEGRYRLAGY